MGPVAWQGSAAALGPSWEACRTLPRGDSWDPLLAEPTGPLFSGSAAGSSHVATTSTGSRPKARSGHVTGTAWPKLARPGQRRMAVDISARLKMNFVCLDASSQLCCKQGQKQQQQVLLCFGAPHEEKAWGGTGSQHDWCGACRDHAINREA
ncbi:hypothetical protein HGM15179_005175, partial [Zosterops borbonicus]